MYFLLTRYIWSGYSSPPTPFAPPSAVVGLAEYGLQCLQIWGGYMKQDFPYISGSQTFQVRGPLIERTKDIVAQLLPNKCADYCLIKTL